MVDDDGGTEDNASSTFLNMTYVLSQYLPPLLSKQTKSKVSFNNANAAKEETDSWSFQVVYVEGRTSQSHSSGLYEMFYNVMYVHIHQFNGWCKFPH